MEFSNLVPVEYEGVFSIPGEDQEYFGVLKLVPNDWPTLQIKSRFRGHWNMERQFLGHTREGFHLRIDRANFSKGEFLGLSEFQVYGPVLISREPGLNEFNKFSTCAVGFDALNDWFPGHRFHPEWRPAQEDQNLSAPISTGTDFRQEVLPFTPLGSGLSFRLNYFVDYSTDQVSFAKLEQTAAFVFRTSRRQEPRYFIELIQQTQRLLGILTHRACQFTSIRLGAPRRYGNVAQAYLYWPQLEPRFVPRVNDMETRYSSIGEAFGRVFKDYIEFDKKYKLHIDSFLSVLRNDMTLAEDRFLQLAHTMEGFARDSSNVHTYIGKDQYTGGVKGLTGSVDSLVGFPEELKNKLRATILGANNVGLRDRLWEYYPLLKEWLDKDGFTKDDFGEFVSSVVKARHALTHRNVPEREEILSTLPKLLWQGRLFLHYALLRKLGFPPEFLIDHVEYSRRDISSKAFPKGRRTRNEQA